MTTLDVRVCSFWGLSAVVAVSYPIFLPLGVKRFVSPGGAGNFLLSVL